MNRMFCSLLMLGAFALVGCASVKPLYATGGSKADGIVELSYTYAWFEAPQVDWREGKMIATQRCMAWGYGSAEPFSGEKIECASESGDDCARRQATIKYQCLGEHP